MDAKLGTVLYEPSANAEKKAKMERDAQNTTTATTGLRLTGCQVSPFPPVHVFSWGCKADNNYRRGTLRQKRSS